MRRTRVLLVVASVVLAAGNLAGSLVRAAQPAANDPFPAAQLTDTPTPSHFTYLPLVGKNASPPPTWVTVVDEDFEDTLGDLWKFYDQSQQGYVWGPSECQFRSPTHSSWAIGGGTLGTTLPCGSGYPGNVDSRMEYGPFSLQDATDAYWRFSLWLDRGDISNKPDFCWYAWSSNTVPWEDCLTADPGTWYTPPTIDLTDPEINVLGESQVWIGFRFTGLGTGSEAEGAYVDDVVIRKCVGGACPPASSSAPAPAASRAGRSPASLTATRSSKSYNSGR